MKIVSNLRVYDMFNSIRASGYSMKERISAEDQEREVDDRDWKRVLNLAGRPSETGEDNFLSGILVSFDLTCSIKMWTEFQRYHFAQIVTSQSTMHRLSKMQLDEACNKYVDPVILKRLVELQKRYNENPTDENKLALLYSCPTGLKLTARVTTNYRQLKTILHQRHNHFLPEWRDFCYEMEQQLPNFWELIAAF